MQISQRSDEEISTLVELAKDWPIEVFYIADSLGSLDAVRTSEIINIIAQNWNADIGVTVTIIWENQCKLASSNGFWSILD